MSPATETKPESKASASQETPSVLLEMGLGNHLKPTAEVTDEPVTAPAPTGESSEGKAASEPAADPKDAHQSTPPAEIPSEKTDAEKALDRAVKQLKGLRDTWTQERQLTKAQQAKILSLESKIDLLMKKVDGTYDETKDAPKATPPEVMVEEGKKSERVAASHFAAIAYLQAVEHLSEEQAEARVKELVWNDDAPFRQFDGDPAVQARVMNARLPIMEAIKVVKEVEAKKQYGNTPEEMRVAIEKEVRTKLEKELRDELKQELRRKGGQIDDVKGLGGVLNLDQKTETAEPSSLQKFESLFPGFVKTAG